MIGIDKTSGKAPVPRKNKAATGHAAGRTSAVNEKDLQFFRSVPILAGLSEAQAREVWRISRRVSYRKGSVIMREGETGDSLFLFFAGQVEVLNTLSMKLGRGGFAETEKSMDRLDAEKSAFSARWRCSRTRRAPRPSPR